MREDKARVQQKLLRKEAMVIAAPFLTKEGQESMRSLKELFYKPQSYTRGDTHHTAFREGYKALIDFIDDNIGIAVRGLNDTGKTDRKPRVRRAGENKETPVQG